MKKVLFIITRLAAGGAPAIMLGMLNALRNSGYDVELATGLANKKERDWLPQWQNLGFKIMIVPSLIRNVNPWHDFFATKQLCQIMKKTQYDVVHTHTVKAGILGRLAAKLSGVKHVFHSPHGPIFEGYFPPILLSLYVILERIAIGWSSKIITLTHKEIDECLKLNIGKREQYQCIYNGVKVERYIHDGSNVQNIRRQYGIPESAIVLSTIGRLVRVKGHIFLLEAVALMIPSLLASERDSLRCLIVGDGEIQKYLEEKAKRLGISKQVIFIGYQEDVAPYLRMSDIFVLPSLNEGFGLVIGEAMASGLPVVATHVGGVPEITVNGENGILVPPGNSKALADAILALLEDRPRLKEIGEENRKRARTHFSLEKMNDEVKQLYNKTLTV